MKQARPQNYNALEIFEDREVTKSWRYATDEHERLKSWWRKSLPVPAGLNRPVRIIDYGCGDGQVGHDLLRFVRNWGSGPQVDYTGVEPVEAQLDAFRWLLDGSNDKYDTQLIRGDIEHFEGSDYDLAIVAHSLYYVSNLPAAVQRIVNQARTVLFVHNGPRGLTELRQRFCEKGHSRPHLTSTDEDILAALNQASLGGRSVRHERIECTTDLSQCLCSSGESRRLISYMLHRPFDSLARKTTAAAAQFVASQYRSQNYRMPNDVGLIYVS